MRAKTRAADSSGQQADANDGDEFVTALLTVSRVLVAVSARSLGEVDEAVTLPQFRTLVVLDNHGEINLNRLAELLQVNSSSAIRMVDRLLTAGLVTRGHNPTNRREVLLGLTPSGRQAVRKVTARRRAEITRIVQAMRPSQYGTLIDALRVFAAAAAEPQPRSDRVSDLTW